MLNYILYISRMLIKQQSKLANIFMTVFLGAYSVLCPAPYISVKHTAPLT